MSSGNYVSVNGNLTDLYRPLTDILGLRYDESMTYEERVQKRYDYVKEQLEKDPNYEGWDWVEYRPYSRSYIGIEFPLQRSFTDMISTKGKLAKQKFNSIKTVVTIGYIAGRYLKGSVRFDKRSCPVHIHRVLGCTFIPKSKRYKDTFYVNLVCNHKNLKTTHNLFKNIEWCTQKDNVRHGIKNNKVRKCDPTVRGHAIVGMSVIPGNNAGKYLVFDSKQEVKKAKLDTISIYQAIRGESETAYGCKWFRISKDETPEHSYELLLDILSDRKRNLSTVKPLLATIVKEGSMKGQQFVIIGAESVRGFGFDQGHVSRVCSGKLKTHAGCFWKYIKNDEVDKYQRNPTLEQLNYLGK